MKGGREGGREGGLECGGGDKTSRILRRQKIRDRHIKAESRIVHSMPFLPPSFPTLLPSLPPSLPPYLQQLLIKRVSIRPRHFQMCEILHRASRPHHYKDCIPPPSSSSSSSSSSFFLLLVFEPAFSFVEEGFSGDFVGFVPGPGEREGGRGVIAVEPDESEFWMVFFRP